MAALPPGAGMPPQSGPTGPGPGAPPPPGMGPGAMPGPGAPPVPGGSLSQPSPPTIFNDVSREYPHVWQLVEMAHMALDQAISTMALYGEPEALADLREHKEDLNRLIHTYADKKRSVGPGKMGGDDDQSGFDMEGAADSEPDGEGHP